MAIGPAYPMYGRDFDASTAAWSLDAVGAYMRLLNHQWEVGYIPDTMPGVASVLRVPPAKARGLWWIVEDKFPVIEAGKRANWRMAELREQREAWSEKSRRGGLKSAAKRQPPLQPPLTPSGPPNGQPKGNIPFPSPIPSEDSGTSSAPNGSGIRSSGVVGRADRHAAQREEIEWRIEEAWRCHLLARERYFQGKNGKAPQPPVMTSETRKAIRDALKEHDAGRLGAEDRERWAKESPVRAAGIGIFLSKWHTGEDERSTGTYLEAWRPWKHQRGKPDPVQTFADLYFARRSAARG